MQALCRRCRQLKPQVTALVMNQLVPEHQRRDIRVNALRRNHQRRAQHTGKHRAVRFGGLQKGRAFPEVQPPRLGMADGKQFRFFHRPCRAPQPPRICGIAAHLPRHQPKRAARPDPEQHNAVINPHGRPFQRGSFGGFHPPAFRGGRLYGDHVRFLRIRIADIGQPRRHLHRRFRQGELHRDQQPHHQHRPHQAQHPRRVTLPQQPAQRQQRQDQQRARQADLPYIKQDLFRKQIPTH